LLSSISCCQVSGIAHRIVAGLGDLEHSDRVRLRLQLAVVVEEGEDRAELGELNEFAGVEAARRSAHARAHGEEAEGVGLALEVAPQADLVAAKEVAGLVGDDSGELRLVAHAQEEAGEDDHEPGRRHEGIELGNVGDIDAEIARRGPPTLAARPPR
jgi:hypothetical protein